MGACSGPLPGDSGALTWETHRTRPRALLSADPLLHAPGDNAPIVCRPSELSQGSLRMPASWPPPPSPLLPSSQPPDTWPAGSPLPTWLPHTCVQNQAEPDAGRGVPGQCPFLRNLF